MSATNRLTHVLLLSLLLLYGITLHPSLPAGDSAELIHVGSSWGIAHPPGYPLYTLIANLFSALPLPNDPIAVNLLSGLLHAIAGVLLYRLLLTLSIPPLIAAAAAFLWGCSQIVWRYSVVAEVFALNDVLCLLLLLAFQQRRWKLLCLTAGLALSNHHVSIFLILPIGAVAVGQMSRRGENIGHWLKNRSLHKNLGWFAIGLSPYLYLALRARWIPFASWGDTSTAIGFFKHFLRSEYGTFQLAQSGLGRSPSIWSGLWTFIHTSILVPAIAVWPIVATIARSRKGKQTESFRPFTRVCLIAACLYLFVFLHLANLPFHDPFYADIYQRFWLQPFLLLYLFSISLMAKKISAASTQQQHRVLLVIALAIALSLFLNAPRSSPGQRQAAARFAHDALTHAPAGALLLTCGDHLSSAVRFLQQSENIRPDVIAVETSQLRASWYRRWLLHHRPTLMNRSEATRSIGTDGFKLSQFIDDNLAHGPILAAGELCNFLNEPQLMERYDYWPQGCNQRISSRGRTQHSTADLLQLPDTLFACDPFNQETPNPSWGAWERALFDAIWKTRADKIEALFSDWKRGERGVAAESLAHTLEQAIAKAPAPWPNLYKYLGEISENLSEGGQGSWQRKSCEAFANYLKIAHPQDPDRKRIEGKCVH